MSREPDDLYSRESWRHLEMSEAGTIEKLRAEVERLKALLRRHHLRGAYWDSELAVETRAALEDKP